MPLRFLIADDLDAHQRLMSNIVGFLGGAVHFASDGREVLELAGADEFDVVLMDMQMPALGGAAAADQLLHQWAGRQRRPRIIAVTAEGTPERRALCRAIGMDGFVAKPYEASALRRALQQVVICGHSWTDGPSRRLFDMKRFVDLHEGQEGEPGGFEAWCEGVYRRLEDLALGADPAAAGVSPETAARWREKSSAFGLLALDQLLGSLDTADSSWIRAALDDLQLCMIAAREALASHADLIATEF